MNKKAQMERIFDRRHGFPRRSIRHFETPRHKALACGIVFIHAAEEGARSEGKSRCGCGFRKCVMIFCARKCACHMPVANKCGTYAEASSKTIFDHSNTLPSFLLFKENCFAVAGPSAVAWKKLRGPSPQRSYDTFRPH